MSKISSRQLVTSASTPQPVGTSGSAGSGDALAFANHVHAHGTQGSNDTAHPAANPSFSGFLWKNDVYALCAIRQACRYATTGSNITLTGGAPQTLDGQTLAGGDRILVKDQTNPAENGIYTITTLGTVNNGTWTRATDAASAQQLVPGTIIAVLLGALNAGSVWAITTPTTGNTITPGTTSISFTQIGGQLASATPSAVAAAGSPGTSKQLAHADHAHAHGTQTDGTMHAAVVQNGANGFMTGAQAQQLYTLQPGVSCSLGYVNAQNLFSTPTTLTWSSSLSVDALGCNDYRCVLAGNTAVTFTRCIDGYAGTFYVKQNSTGNYTASFAATAYPSGSVAVIKDTSLSDLNPNPAANSITMYAYNCVALGGTLYVHVAKSYLA